MRRDNRSGDDIRPVKITRGFTSHAEGSVLIEMGSTWVLCTATIENKVPPFLKGSGTGWVTAEYGMLPRATVNRTPRPSQSRISGRTMEIQRLIGRSLRAVTDLTVLGERTITLDCDVLQADGGTRTAAITGGFVALVDALATLRDEAQWAVLPVTDWLAAVSVGLVDGQILVDLSYDEDVRAQVDLNVVATSTGRLVEVQGGAEASPFSRQILDDMLDKALKAVNELIEAQQEALSDLSQLIGRWSSKHAPTGQ